MIKLRWRDDAGQLKDVVEAIVLRPLAHLRRLRSVRILDGAKKAAKVPRMEPQAHLVIDRPDAPWLRVSLSAWSKILGLLGREGPRLVEFSEAFDLAISEMLHLNDSVQGHLTSFAEVRMLRRERLQSTIEEEGIDRAAVLFALEERDAPDLTHPVVRSNLSSYAIRYVRAERMTRNRSAKKATKRKKGEASTVEGMPEGAAWPGLAEARPSVSRDSFATRAEGYQISCTDVVAEVIRRRRRKDVLALLKVQPSNFDADCWALRLAQIEKERIAYDDRIALEGRAKRERRVRFEAERRGRRNARRRELRAQKSLVAKEVIDVSDLKPGDIAAATILEITLGKSEALEDEKAKSVATASRSSSGAESDQLGGDQDEIIERLPRIRFEDKLRACRTLEEQNALFAASKEISTRQNIEREARSAAVERHRADLAARFDKRQL